MRIFHLVKLYEHPVVPPLDDEVGVDLDGEVAVVDLQDLKVVEADGDVQRLDDALPHHGDRWHIPENRSSDLMRASFNFIPGIPTTTLFS